MKKKTVAVCMANIDEQYNDVFLHRFRKFAEENDINLLYFYCSVRFILWIRMISESGKYIV